MYLKNKQVSSRLFNTSKLNVVPEDSTILLCSLTDTYRIHVQPSYTGKRIIKKTI